MDLAQPRADRYYSREEFRQWCEAQTKGRYEPWMALSLPCHLNAGRTCRSRGGLQRVEPRGRPRRCALPGIAGWRDGGNW